MFKIAHLYPKELNLYGDKGNILYLQHFLLIQGVKSSVTEISVGESLNESFDFIFSGGGPDSLQSVVYEDFLLKKDALSKHIKKGKPAVFICGSYQLLGKYYLTAQKEKIKGLGLFDFFTKSPENQSSRIVGNTFFKFNKTFFGNTVVGFENHNGRTILSKTIKPLGKSFSTKSGNNDIDLGEGFIYKKTIGSYLHGPLFVKNPNILLFLLQDYLDENLLEKGFYSEYISHQNALHKIF